MEEVCWESIKTKHTNILQLFSKELAQNAEEAAHFLKDYPHKLGKTKEILITKLKAERIKFREVCYVELHA